MSRSGTASLAASGGIHEKRVFLGCFLALVATAFGFAVRAAILEEWRGQFNLSNEQIGYIGGAGLYPFAISIILFSLVIDRIGYGISMGVAFVLHITSSVITLCAPLALAGAGASTEEIAAGQRLGYQLLYLGTFIYALGNGTVEAVINPVVATMFGQNKTHWLNILHAGWPGGLVLGGLLAIAISYVEPGSIPGSIWQWQMAVVLIPMVTYGIILAGQRFPVQERVAAGVSYMDMLKEFGAGSSLVVCFLLFAGLDQILQVLGSSLEIPGLHEQLAAAMPLGLAKLVQYLLLALIPAALFGVIVRTFGRPMFVFLLLVMVLLATTELGTDGWISDIMRSVLESSTKGTLFLVYTSLIMFVLRFFAGPIVHRISPLGLLATCAAIASLGLLWLSTAQATGMLFLAATFYGFGKTFFWPTTLGVVSEQYPKGGALMLNAIAGVGMLAVGVLGGPAIGFLMDERLDDQLRQAQPEVHAQVMKPGVGMFGEVNTLDQEKLAELPADQKAQIEETQVSAKQGTLATVAILPAIMFVCYLILIAYFRSRGGYKAQVLTGHAAHDEEFTGGLPGPAGK
jgi:MFS family permease